MLNINIEKYSSIKNEILDFLEKQKQYYLLEEYRYMKFMIYTSGVIHCKESLPVSLLQILSKYDIIKDEMDYYKVFANILREKDLIRGNCCEVAAGIYPRLSEIIYPDIEKNHSSLTIYDPKLSINRLGNAKLYKTEFNYKTDISNIATLVSMFPCEATIPLVEKSIEEDKNLLVALCDCNLSTNNYPLMDGKYWSSDFCKILKNKYGDELEILYWPKEVNQDTVILYRNKNR